MENCEKLVVILRAADFFGSSGAADVAVLGESRLEASAGKLGQVMLLPTKYVFREPGNE
jgi:hypothetical protein